MYAHVGLAQGDGYLLGRLSDAMRRRAMKRMIAKVGLIDDNHLAAAKRMMPKADLTSQEILAASSLMGLMLGERAEGLTHIGNLHHDVTGIYNRTNGSRRRR
jgi:hypothetical protein